MDIVRDTLLQLIYVADSGLPDIFIFFYPNLDFQDRLS